MKTILLIFAVITTLSIYSQQNSSTVPQYLEGLDTTLQTTDTISTGKSLNDIRFDRWEDSNWLDNEYIRTLRKYLDDYNDGIVSNPALDPYKEHIKGQFIIYEINPFILGGAYIRIVFFDMPDRIFSSWIYSEVNKDKEIVGNYELRFISIDEETTDMTKWDILQAIKEMEGLKLW